VTVVVSTGHSGTKWLTDALTACGVPADHEVRFNHNRPEQPVDTAVSVSWAAAPHVARLLAADEPVVALVRDPLDVVRSIISGRGEGFLRNPRRPSTRFAQEHRPDLCEIDDLLARAVAFVATWCPKELATVRVEDGPETLHAIASVAEHLIVPADLADEACASLGTDVNSHVDGAVDVGWDDIFETVYGDRLAALAVEHGYAS
jgi:hypothetical protein